MSTRTFKVTRPHMTGTDIRDWQTALNSRMNDWGIGLRVTVDGDYGIATRDMTATVLEASGLLVTDMASGVTPELRTKVRSGKLTAVELARFAKRVGYRRKIRARYADGGETAPPLGKILQSSWGYHPPVHDGVDLICAPNAPLLAICDAQVIRADAAGWWGKGAPSPAVAAKGDGIIVLRSLTDVGPFRKGLNFGYGHAERPVVKVGETVRAGQHIGTAGFANAWHIHLIVNDRPDDRGVGTMDPMVFVNFSLEHAR